MKIISRGTVTKGIKNTSKAICFLPSVECLDKGNLILTYRTGSSKFSIDGQIQIKFSDDNGESWSSHETSFNKEFNSIKGTFRAAYPFKNQQGELMMAFLWLNREEYPSKFAFNEKTLGLVPAKALLSKSKDNGVTWSELYEIDVSPYKCPMPLMNRIYITKNNVWICPFEKYKDFNDEEKWEQEAVMKFSYDSGKTWPDYVICAKDKSGQLLFNDHRGTVLNNGVIINAYATYDSEIKRYDAMYMNNSKDGGKTWTKPRKTNISGMPSQPVELSDGRIAIAYVDQKIKKCIGLVISYDFGETWDVGNEIIIYDGDITKNKNNNLDKEKYHDWVAWSYGLPQAVVLKDNQIFVTYYCGNQESTDIEYAVIQC